MSDQPPSSPGWVPPGQPQPPSAPWTPPPGQQPPTYTPGGGTSIPPPPPQGPPTWNQPVGPGGPGGPWQSQPPSAPGGGGNSKLPLILGGVAVLVVLALIAAGALLLGGDDDDKDDVATDLTTETESETDTETTTETETETTSETETETETESGVLEPPTPADGYQVYEDPAGEFAVTFPNDWTKGESTDIGGQQALLVASGPADSSGFTPNLNMLSLDGAATDGEFPPNFGQTQTDALEGSDAIEGVDFVEGTIGGRNGLLLTYLYNDGSTRADGYQFYVASETTVYILTVTVPEGGDQAMAEEIGNSLRVA